MKQPINLRIDVDVLATLDAYATELSKSRTELIQKSIELYFDTLDEIISDKRIDEIKAGKTQVYSLEQVAKELGLTNV